MKEQRKDSPIMNFLETKIDVRFSYLTAKSKKFLLG